MDELKRLLASVESARASVLDSVAELTDSQGSFKPSPDQWSVVEILERPSGKGMKP